MTIDPNAERGFTITRVFEAPPELVWQAWTEPDQFAQWFGGPPTRLESVQMDVRVGGTWSARMVIPDHPGIPWFGRYLELDHPRRMVIEFTDQGPEATQFELWTVSLRDLGGSTELTLRQSGGHLSDQEYERAKQGTEAFLQQMADVIAKR